MSVLDLNLGIDFGTRYTKVCIRDTVTEGGQSWVVQAGNASSALNRALILSQIGIDQKGRIHAGLTQEEWQSLNLNYVTEVDYIKMRLAHLDIGQTESRWYSPHIDNLLNYGLSIEDILENICAFFLFKVIQRSQAWFSENQKNLLKNRTVEWGVQIGVPVAYWDSPALSRFEKVLRLAWHLMENPLPNDSFELVNSTLMDLKGKIDLEEIPCCAIPEVAAAISSFTSSRQVQLGVYSFFDVGGGTIEGVSFHFYRDRNSYRRIDFYTALVEPLGVNSIAKKIVDQFPSLRETSVEKSILFNGDSILKSIQRLSNNYRSSRKKKGWHIANKHEAIYELVEDDLNYNHLNTFFVQTLILSQRWIHTQVAQVFLQFFKKAKSYSGQPFLFLSGGGKASPYYQDTIQSTYEAFAMKSRKIPRYQYLDLPVPDDCLMGDLEPDHFHRFTVAYGLSIPDYEYPKIALPAQFPNLAPQRAMPSWVPETSLDD